VKKELGYRIRKLRESRDYTQENMAAELGITAGAYAKIERGETDASFTRLVHIAEILDVQLSNLLSGTSASPSFEETGTSGYGFASKTELDTLSQLIRQISRKLEKLETEMALLKGAKLKPAK
jgi:transcriptional regulator with XRE-family HTH domain